MTKELFHKNWDFTLYQVEDKLVISVVFFGMVDYHRSFVIDPNKITNNNYEVLSSLAEQIRTNPDQFKKDEIIPAIFD